MHVFQLKKNLGWIKENIGYAASEKDYYGLQGEQNRQAWTIGQVEQENMSYEGGKIINNEL